MAKLSLWLVLSGVGLLAGGSIPDFFSSLAAALVNALHAFFAWYTSVPSDGDSRDTLVAIAAVAVAVWTGALIAFQLRGVSVELQGALTFLHYAFIAPLFGLFTSGWVLRTLALSALVYFAYHLVMFSVAYYFAATLQSRNFEKTVEKMNPHKGDDDPLSDDEWLQLQLDVSRKAVTAAMADELAPVFRLELIFATVCTAATGAVFIYPTNVVLASASVLTLVMGVRLVFIALDSDESTETKPTS